MSKEKETSGLDDIEKKLAKDFGLDLENSTKNLLEAKRAVIPVSPKMDMILGGGVPEGSFSILTSMPKVGKSSTSLQLAANAQKIPSDWGTRKVYYFDVEGRLKKRDMEGIAELQTDPDHWMLIKSEPGNILTAAKFLTIAEQLINAKPGCVFIMDSFSSLCSEDEMKNDFGKRFRSDIPLLLASWVRRIGNVIPVNKSIVVGITHQIANMGMGPSTKSEASGNKIQFQSDVKLRFTHKTPWTVGSGDKQSQIGQSIHAVAEWSALEATPNMKCEAKLRYGYGLDKEQELVDLCVDFGLIEKKGAWFTLDEDNKFQGAEKVREYFVQNPKAFDQMYNQVREMMGFVVNESVDA